MGVRVLRKRPAPAATVSIAVRPTRTAVTAFVRPSRHTSRSPSTAAAPVLIQVGGEVRRADPVEGSPAPSSPAVSAMGTRGGWRCYPCKGFPGHGDSCRTVHPTPPPAVSSATARPLRVPCLALWTDVGAPHTLLAERMPRRGKGRRRPAQPSPCPPGVRAFVRLRGEAFLRGTHTTGTFGHAHGHHYLSGGRPVLSAGMVETAEGGTIVRWTNMSGTYRPPLGIAAQTGLPLSKLRPFRPDKSPERLSPVDWTRDTLGEAGACGETSGLLSPQMRSITRRATERRFGRIIVLSPPGMGRRSSPRVNGSGGSRHHQPRTKFVRECTQSSDVATCM